MNQQEASYKPVICRICLTSFNDNTSLHLIQNSSVLKGSFERRDLLSLVFEAISVSICFDSSEYKICDSCDHQLLTTVKFLEMCKKSEDSLKQRLIEPEITIKLEKTDDNETTRQVSEPVNTKVCHLCSKEFFSTRQLTLHLAKSHKKAPTIDGLSEETESVFCDFCRKKFSTKIILTKHLQKHVMVPVYCFCGKKFNSERLLRKHKTVHTPNKYKCSQCDKSFRVKISLLTHENTHRGVKPFLCAACPLAYASYSGLLNHQRRHHSSEVWVEKKSSTFLCETCGRNFTRKDHLKRHVLHRHSKNVERTFSCSHCSKAFISNHHLTNHVRIHLPPTFTCADCDRSFITSTRLNMHVRRVHLQLRPFPCTTCEKRFKVKAHLDKHVRTHTGEKPHQCPFCSYKCAEKSNLRKHFRVHDRKS